MTTNGEPEYTAKEMRARKKEIRKLRDQAVRSWEKDRVGSVAIVMMTFREYLALVGATKRKAAA